MTCWQQVQATADEHCLEAPWRPRCWLLEKTRTRCSLGAGSKADYTEAGAEGIHFEFRETGAFVRAQLLAKQSIPEGCRAVWHFRWWVWAVPIAGGLSSSVKQQTMVLRSDDSHRERWSRED